MPRSPQISPRYALNTCSPKPAESPRPRADSPKLRTESPLLSQKSSNTVEFGNHLESKQRRSSAECIGLSSIPDHYSPKPRRYSVEGTTPKSVNIPSTSSCPLNEDLSISHVKQTNVDIPRLYSAAIFEEDVLGFKVDAAKGRSSSNHLSSQIIRGKLSDKDSPRSNDNSPRQRKQDVDVGRPQSTACHSRKESPGLKEDSPKQKSRPKSASSTSKNKQEASRSTSSKTKKENPREEQETSKHTKCEDGVKKHASKSSHSSNKKKDGAGHKSKSDEVLLSAKEQKSTCAWEVDLNDLLAPSKKKRPHSARSEY